MSDKPFHVLLTGLLESNMGINDPAFLRDVFSDYLERIQNLGRALMAESMDAKEARHEIHKLKSSSAAVGAIALSQRLNHSEAPLRDGLSAAGLPALIEQDLNETIDATAVWLASLKNKTEVQVSGAPVIPRENYLG
ncbi:MAG: Hpt domain-containing protein [Pseudohongiellaceae bacterium]